MKMLLDQTIAIPGKRIRPALTLLVGKALHGEEEVITTMAAAIDANLDGASSDLLVITTGTLPPTTTPAAHAPIK